MREDGQAALEDQPAGIDYYYSLDYLYRALTAHGQSRYSHPPPSSYCIRERIRPSLIDEVRETAPSEKPFVSRSDLVCRSRQMAVSSIFAKELAAAELEIAGCGCGWNR